MNKLGAVWNVFDGIELLEYSLKSIRNCVDYTIVIYQDVSNYGNKSTVNTLELLNRLKESKLIDEIILYHPDLKLNGHGNELAKRNLGLNRCRQLNCKYYISLDTDELYTEDEFNKAFEYIKNTNCDASACKMLTFYKTPEFVVDPPEEYVVPFIYKITDKNFKLGTIWPVAADCTRKLEYINLKLFERSEIQMRHYSYVRNDIRAKLKNSSASGNFSSRIEEIARYHDTWTEKKKCLLAGKEQRFYDVKKVEDVFKITI